MTAVERYGLLEEARGIFQPWVGEYEAEGLARWVAEEIGEGLEIPGCVLSVVSGNTAHAAWQSVFRGLVLGARNLVKLPSEGLEGFEAEVAGLPEGLRELVETSRVLRGDWEKRAEAWVVYGSDETVGFFRERCPAGVPFVGHGHRLGIGLVRSLEPRAARAAVRDVCEFEQRGCLSMRTLFVEGDVFEFGAMLARAFDEYEEKNPAPRGDLSERGAVATLREEARFRVANGVAGHGLWEGENLGWTVVAWPDSRLRISPMGRTLFLQPAPEDWADLGELRKAVSGTGVWPLGGADTILHFRMAEWYQEGLPGFRVFRLGEAQKPPFDWHQDGVRPLRSLCR